MALTVYPTADYDSYISLIDANDFISKYTTFNTQWTALSDADKEVYLRIATFRIDDRIDATLKDGTDTCLTTSCAVMAVHDVVYEISSSVNPNIGAITREKVGDIEAEYSQRRNAKGRTFNPYPPMVRTCLSGYGVVFSSGVNKATVSRS